MTDHSALKRRRILLLTIAAIFFGSLLLGGVLRFSGWRPSGTKNHGEILRPYADLRAISPQLTTGQIYSWAPKERLWRILLVPSTHCVGTCTDTVAHNIDIVWQLMGRHANRIDILWLCPQNNCTPPSLLQEHSALHMLEPNSKLRAALPDVDKHRTKNNAVPVYVIDPNGFVVLRYPSGFDPSGLRSDLAKLLKLK